MSIASDKTVVTLEELLASPDSGRFEIVNGQLEEIQVSNLSVSVGMKLSSILTVYCQAAKSGETFGPDCYYQCFGHDRTRARRPDISFIARERLPADWLAEGYFNIPPDLAVEVISTNDRAYEVSAKVSDYLAAGVKLVWVIDPQDRHLMIHRLDGTVQKLSEQETLTGEQVLAGFSCRVAEFLPACG